VEFGDGGGNGWTDWGIGNTKWANERTIWAPLLHRGGFSHCSGGQAARQNRELGVLSGQRVYGRKLVRHATAKPVLSRQIKAYVRSQRFAIAVVFYFN
jgi:hypothetical protein